MIRIYDAAFATATGTDLHHLGTFWWINEQTGAKGRMTRSEAYEYVASNPRGHVFVRVGADKVTVLAHKNSAGTKWIQTVADGTTADNLLTLAERHRRGLPNM